MLKKTLVLFLAMLVCACAKKMPTPEPEEGDAALVWHKMETAPANSGPYRLQLSLRFGSEGEMRRVAALMWGNNSDHLRLDVMAGVGALLARIEENGDHFVLYDPRADKTYIHDGPNRPLLKIGVPLPFTLVQLAEILNGEYGRVFGKDYSTAEIENHNFSFTFADNPGVTLVLDNNGLPVAWRQSGTGWKIFLDYSEDHLPETIRLENSNGRSAILSVKKRETPESSFPTDRLVINVPDDALPLSEYKPS